MEENQQRWQQCLQIIQEHLAKQKDGDWVFSTWFKQIQLEEYDRQQNNLLLRIPSAYIYEYVEHYYAQLLGWAIRNVFGKTVRLQYHLMANASGHPVNLLQEPTSKNVRICIPDAAERFKTELQKLLGNQAQWLEGYNKIVSWLTDNQGRGLLCVGTPGLGKTLICKRILPALLGCNIPVVNAHEMTVRIDELLKERILIIDDLGKESVEVKQYGNLRIPFFELCDAAEQQGNLLIITTNLSTTPDSDPRYPTSLKERYGDAVYSRLRATMTSAIIRGEDMRNIRTKK